MVMVLRSVLAAAIVAVVSGYPGEKLFACCTKVSTSEITEPIIKFEVQKPSPPCVRAIIFTTKTRHYCSHLGSPWVHQKIKELIRAKAQPSTPQAVPSSPPASSPSSSFLLSVLTSTASRPSSPTSLSSSSPSPSFFSSASAVAESETSSGTS
ncbi:uncharacterized protein FYW61_016351 isoform 1-T1 [Anableps anableps]